MYIPFSVFSTLSEILFVFNQLTRWFKSALTSVLSFLIELLRYNRLMSSAKWGTLGNLIARWKWFLCNNDRGDPRTDLWGTPQFIAAKPES